MHERGVSATTLDEILAVSGTGKSQFYHYFPDKNALVIEVLAHQLDRVLEAQSSYALDSWEGIGAWFQAMIESHERSGLNGCPLGSIAAEAVELTEPVRRSAAGAFGRWEATLRAHLETMRGRGELVASADPAALAEAVITVIQGGYLLASVKRDVRPMREALDVALRHLHSYAATARPEQRWERLSPTRSVPTGTVSDMPSAERP